MSSDGSRASHFASTTFCWFPPESELTGFESRPYLICSRVAQSRREPALGNRGEEAELHQPPERRERDVAHDRRAHHEALLAAVLGHEGDPGRHGGAGRASAEAAVRHLDRARVVVVDAEDRPGDLASARANEPGKRDDLTGAHLEGHVEEDPFARQPGHSKHRRADGLLGGHPLRQVAADHRPHEIVGAEALERRGPARACRRERPSRADTGRTPPRGGAR